MTLNGPVLFLPDVELESSVGSILIEAFDLYRAWKSPWTLMTSPVDGPLTTNKHIHVEEPSIEFFVSWGT